MKKAFKDALLRPYYSVRTRLISWWGGFPLIGVYNGHFFVTYRGIPTFKCPFDYVMYQMILSEISPDLVVEIGTNEGGTALYLADLMDAIGYGTIHTIDIKDGANETARRHPRIKFFTEGWEKYDLKNGNGFSKILVIDDASHNHPDTFNAMKKFAPLISVGSYLIVEDGIVTKLGRDGSLNGGPLRSIHEFLRTDLRFAIDRKRSDMFGKDSTFNIDGYLKRIK
ncbi:MAG: CmcI family methyltransferase [Patescibacteria group bacterium]